MLFDKKNILKNPLHREDIDKGSVYWVNWVIFQVLLFLLSYFCLHFRGQIAICLADYLVLMYAGKMPTKSMPKSKLKQTPADFAVCVLCEPHSLLTPGGGGGLDRIVEYLVFFDYTSNAIPYSVFQD